MGAIIKLQLILLILTLSGWEPTSGASVISSKYLLKSKLQTDSCRLTLPRDRNYAPSITDQKSFQEVLPTQNTGSGLWHFNIGNYRKVKVNCGMGNSLNLNDPSHYIFVYCENGNLFNDDEEIISSPQAECLNPRKPTPIVIRNGTCSSGKGTNFDVEFINESPPRKFYSVCVNEETSGTFYTTSYLDGGSFSNGSAESGGNRPDFRGQEIYPFPIKQAYKWENAYEHLSELLGSPDLVDEYFPTQQYRFSRGHLFPNGDGIKRFEKHATFHYINTVPQWQVLNGGNWAIVEQDVRDLAASLRRTFSVITGSFEVTSLTDANNNKVEIYLARDPTGKLRLPVPRLVWKVIHDPIGSSAVAIVQINNPWIQIRNARDINILCNDVCSSLPWLRSDGFQMARKGYTYCCDVKELRARIAYIPDLKYNGLLGENFVNANSGESEDYDHDDASSSSDSTSSSSTSESESNEAVKKDQIMMQNITQLFNSIRLG